MRIKKTFVQKYETFLVLEKTDFLSAGIIKILLHEIYQNAYCIHYNVTYQNDIHHNDIHHNDIHHNDIHQNDIHQNDIHQNDIHQNDIHQNEIHQNDTQYNDIKQKEQGTNSAECHSLE